MTDAGTFSLGIPDTSQAQVHEVTMTLTIAAKIELVH